MRMSAGLGWRTRPRGLACTSLAGLGAVVMSGCGGGGNTGASTTAAPGPISVVYAHSQVLGLPLSQTLTFVPATPPAQAAVLALAGGGLPEAGSTQLTAEYVPPSLANVRVACISGNGTSIGVLDAINPGVVSVSAAVMLGTEWVEADPNTATAAAAAAAEHLQGWENCGVKSEGSPFKSSTVTPAADGSYTEDVLIGNPTSTFTAVRLAISSLEVVQMR